MYTGLLHSVKQACSSYTCVSHAHFLAICRKGIISTRTEHVSSQALQLPALLLTRSGVGFSGSLYRNQSTVHLQQARMPLTAMEECYP